MDVTRPQRHEYGAPCGIRTRVTAVRGRRPGPLDEGSIEKAIIQVSAMPVESSVGIPSALLSYAYSSRSPVSYIAVSVGPAKPRFAP